MSRILSFLLIFLLSVCNGAAPPPQISTPLGKVEGHMKVSYNGRKFMAFEGIPYAKPPVGKLRFNEAQPVEPWKGVWPATSLYECVQRMWITDKIFGSEDCLYINVYIPRQEPVEDNEALDVVVHIHGGGFTIGSGHDYAKPEYIMDTNLIFVTFNYRLGMFGFLSTEDKLIPGNNGLKDQVLALKWIQENIASFGGNPNSITITGMSAGGASVHYHYLSPLSKGLFHRGISMSGVPLNPWAQQKQPLRNTQRIAVAVGCPDTKIKTMIECLKQRPTEHLLEKMSIFNYEVNTPLYIFGPVVEHEETTKAFLTEHPYLLLRQKKVLDVPWITSNTADDGMFMVMFVLDKLEEVNAKWNDIAPVFLGFNYTVPRDQWPSVAQKIKDYYLEGSNDISMGTLKQFYEMTTHRIFSNGAELSAKLQAAANKSPVYYYHFNYESSSTTYSQLFVPNRKLPGVCHMDDGLYLFPNIVPGAVPTKTDLQMKDSFLHMLESFAKTGKPTFKTVTWDPTGSTELTFLNISAPNNMKMQSTKEIAARSFWRKLGIMEIENLFSIKDEL